MWDKAPGSEYNGFAQKLSARLCLCGGQTWRPGEYTARETGWQKWRHVLVRIFSQGKHLPLLSRVPVQRDALVRAGVRIELLTVAWMVLEAAVAIGAGIVPAVSRSPALA